MNLRLAVCQPWADSSKGSGQTPNGYSLHISESEHAAYLKRISVGRLQEPSVPDHYETPYGSTYLVEVDNEMYKQLKKEKTVHQRYGRAPARFVLTEQ